MGLSIEYLLSCVNGVSDDDDFGDVFLVAGLINATSDSKEFYFSTGDEGRMMNCFDQRLVMYVDVRNQSGNIIHDARVGNNNCCVGDCGSLNSHVV